MLQQYFATAWIPHNDGTNNFYTANLGNGIAAIGYKSQPVTGSAWSDWRDEQHPVGWPGNSGQNGSCCSAPGSDR